MSNTTEEIKNTAQNVKLDAEKKLEEGRKEAQKMGNNIEK